MTWNRVLRGVTVLMLTSLLGSVACGDSSSTQADAPPSDTTLPNGVAEPATGSVLATSDSIVVTFDETMDTSSLTLGGGLAALADSGTWSTTSETDDTLTLAPMAGWDATTDAGTLTIDASDVAGNAAATIALDYTMVLGITSFQAASFVIGQTGFSGDDEAQGGSVAANTLSDPYGNPVIFDGKLYLGDYDAHRITVYNPVPNANNPDADFAIGQTSLTDDDTGISATMLDGAQTPTIVGGKLFLIDYENDRALIYNTIPTSGPATADVAIGQPDLVSGSSDCTASTLDSAETVTVVDGKVIITDTRNHRVLIWNAVPTTSGVAADIVLGQNAFDTCTENDDNQDDSEDANPTARTLQRPAGAWTDGTRLAINDSGNHRILIWNTFPTSSFTPADVVLGQADFTSGDENRGGAAAANTLSAPFVGIHSNGTQLAVSDTDNNRVLLWNSFPTTNGAPADIVVGQANFSNRTEDDDDQDGSSDSSPSARTLEEPVGVLIHRNQLWVVDGSNNRVLVFEDL